MATENRKAKIIFFLIPASLIMLAVVFSAEPLVIFFAKKQLQKVFVASEVSIGRCRLKPWSSLLLSDVSIQRKNSYSCALERVLIEYSIPSLLRGAVDKVSLYSPLIAVTLSDKPVSVWSQYLNLGTGSAVAVKNVEVQNARIDARFKDAAVKTEISCGFDLQRQILQYLRLSLPTLGIGEAQIKNASCYVAQGQEAGSLSVEKIGWKKAAVRAIKAEPSADAQKLIIDAFSAQLSGGEVTGKISALTGGQWESVVEAQFSSIDLEALIKDFQLEEKLALTGRLNGICLLRADASGIGILEGNFTTAGGGVLNIKDDSMLKHMASGKDVSTAILVESLKNFQYNTGIMKLGMERGNIVLDISLEGQAGRRALTIVLHERKTGG